MSNLSITVLEVFSPELFIEIFHFLNGYDIYKAFYGLNHRLSTLVLNYGIKYIDLSEIKLNESRKILSDINCSEINTLKLSNKYNDEQIDQIFDNNHLSLSNFNYLRSLTFDSIGLFTFHLITRQDFNLSQLESLIIRFRSGLCQEKLLIMYNFILNNFCFRFKSLKLLDLSILDDNEFIFDTDIPSSDLFLSSTNSCCSTLKYLSIGNMFNNRIETILSYFPNLYKLTAMVELNGSVFNYPLLSNLKSCTLVIISFQLELLVCLLKQCNNLEQLFIYADITDSDAIDIDSYQLENLIENYLLKLKKFQIRLFITYISIDILENLFINNFKQNKFWIERKTKIDITNEQSTSDGRFQADINIEFSI